MFCSKCGAQNVDSAAFCSSCGNSMGLKTSIEEQTKTQPEQAYISQRSGYIPVKAEKGNNVVAMVSIFLFIVSLLLPCVSYFGSSQSLMYDGSYGMICVIAQTLFVIFMATDNRIPELIVSIVICCIVVYKIIEITSGSYGLIKYEIGFYLHIGSAILLFIAMVVDVVKNKTN